VVTEVPVAAKALREKGHEAIVQLSGMATPVVGYSIGMAYFSG
jgi:hypothetical protein